MKLNFKRMAVILVICIIAGIDIGICIGQNASLWIHDEFKLCDYSHLYTVHDDARGVICYAIATNNSSGSSSISCVKVK
jgi:hypothetical protein